MYWSEKWRCLAIEEKNQVMNRKHGRGTYGKNGVCESCLEDHEDEHRQEEK